MVAINPPKILIADPEDAFRLALAEALAPRFRVQCCANGAQALELALSWKPDALILELVLPGLDGVELLRQLAARGCQPAVLVVTALGSDFVLGALEKLNVSYVMLKTCPVQRVADRTRELLEPREAPGSTGELLMELGLSSGHQGFQRLLVALPLLAAQPDQRLTKELYRHIICQGGGSIESVEKNIRDAIRAGWVRGNREAWKRYFPGLTRCPRNKEFLFRLADLLSDRRKCG